MTMLEWPLRLLQPFGQRFIVGRTWDLHVRGAHHVPQTGPVILAANHMGWLDGPLLIVCAPRPAHALVKMDAFEGRSGHLLRLTGQIPIDRDHQDSGALRTAVSALEGGQAVVVYPEGSRGDGELTHIMGGAAWLALTTGAPIVPVALFGTRLPGAPADSKPPRGSRLDIVYGGPLHIAAQPWPRTTALVAETTDRVHDHLREHLARAKQQTPQSLPGPLPEGTIVV